MGSYNRLTPKSLVRANLSRSKRSILAKLKLGVLPLRLETGRWEDEALELRICNMCKEFKLDKEKPVIAFIGRLVREKGADLIPDLVKRLIAQKEEFNFIILGTNCLIIQVCMIDKMLSVKRIVAGDPFFHILVFIVE